MTRLVHLTDLHFGRERADLVAPLQEAVRACAPDLVIVSGDLSHRARRAQFRRAMAFLRGLDLPFLTIPGNHDVPLFNLLARMLFPFRGYCRAVPGSMTPEAELGPLRIFSANTADPHSLRRGILRGRDLKRICAGMRRTPGDGVNILVCHHPLREPPGFERGETKGAAQALPQLQAAGLQIVLSGHLHHWAIGLGITPETPQPILQVQTGTALCGRVGETDHGFSVLDIRPGDVTVTPWLADEASCFRPAAPHCYLRRDGLWHIADQRVGTGVSPL
ncbi:metallophosphoesterase family protein [Paenirhodobacter populi]|uniref:metallophosphoesterase family protein n=1 Tax=Paenirhodobacter populi TaxID=2306993 RepID=UPI000FE2CCE0|nr:metallophosphoesterase [Sinirhodobacter populi]RWR06586.1 metallophosphoesterase [Sinirhodobacter populi]